MQITAIVIGFLALVVALALIGALPVMWLWNWLMPVIFGLKTITFWQAFGLSMLCSILFKSSSSCNCSKS